MAALVITSHQQSKVGKKRRKTVLLARRNALLEMVVLVVAGAPNASQNTSPYIPSIGGYGNNGPSRPKKNWSIRLMAMNDYSQMSKNLRA